MFERAIENFIPIDLDEMRFQGFLEKRAREIKQCVDNVSKGQGWKGRLKKCPVCASEKEEVLLHRYGIDILKCGNCGVGYVEKFPVDLADVYSDAEYLPIAQSDYLDHEDYRKKRFAKERIELIRQYGGKKPEETRLLDVGCGTGWFLNAAQEVGFRVAGQEFGKDLAKFTSERLGIRVWEEPITEIPAGEKFDAITLFDVIEHVPNPREVIQAVADHLNPGGVSLLFTPNLDSFAFSKLGDRNSLLMPVEHLFYFTEKSLGRIVGDVGLKVLHFSTKGMDIPDIYSYYRDETDKKDVAEFLRENCSSLQAMIDQSGCANHMRFIVQKEK